MVVPLRDVEDCTGSWDVKPFVAVADEEVWIELCQVERYVPYAVGRVDHAQDSVGLTETCESFEGHADPGHGDDGVEDCEAGFLAFSFDRFDGVLEIGAEVFVRDWVGVFDLSALGWGGLGDVFDCFVAASVDCGEVDDHISGLVDEVAEDGVYAGAGVGYENDAFDWRVEILGNGCSGCIVEAWVFVADRPVWSCLLLVLQVA